MLEEDSAMGLVERHIPPYSEAQRLRVFALVLDEASQFGVTSIQDNSVMSLPDTDNYGWQNFLGLRAVEKRMEP